MFTVSLRSAFLCNAQTFPSNKINNLPNSHVCDAAGSYVTSLFLTNNISRPNLISRLNPNSSGPAVRCAESLVARTHCIADSGAKFRHNLSTSSASSNSPICRRDFLGGVVPGLLMFSTPAVMLASPSPSHARAKSSTSEAQKVLENVEWPSQFPFRAEDFQRYDETEDTYFYSYPRFVTHIDDYAIDALTKFYSQNFPPPNTPGVAILDMCSSWISHYPKGYKADRIAGLGLNEDELKKNPILSEYVVQDLNTNPNLPYADNSFDVITNAVSVDYLTKPIEIFKEMNRVLKPGGLAIMSFSNRCFFTKAISIWTSTGDLDHIFIVGSYFHYSGGFEEPKASDISPNPGRTDPMYVVYSRKLQA